ncbi:MAG: M56 family metallopeptidase, partial [Bacteroidota bacterium]
FYKIRKTKIENKGTYLLVPTDGQLPTFSFFRLLFFDNSVGLTPEECDKIIDHERVHMSELHSLDILLLEFVKIIFWFNPVVWLVRKHVEDIHEYIADQKIIKKTDESDYSSLLAKMALQKMSLSIGHHFNKSLTLKRITMMKKPSNRIKSWKVATLIPIVLLVVVAIACNDEVINDLDAVMETSAQTAVPDHLMKDMEILKKNHPEADFVYLEFSEESEEAFQRLRLKLDEYDPESIGLVDMNKTEKRIGLIINKNGALKKVAKSEFDSEGLEIFTIVDEPATPPGGDFQQYYSQVGQTLKYPEQARKLGVEGKVYVQFIVQKDGSLKNVQVVKGIGAGCDMEAKKTIESLTGWSPGKQNGLAVNQKLVLPISFNLGNPTAEKTEDN